MYIKKFVQLIIVAALLITPFAMTGSTLAWSQCPTYITVQWGDTLSGIAKKCDTTVDAIRAANPDLGWWLYTGQVIYIPGGYTPPSQPTTYNTYTVQWGDTLGKIATRSGTTVSNLLAVNPQIKNPSLIYVGQVINLPSGISVPPPATKPTPTPSPSSDSYKIVRITYEGGLFIRTAPGSKIISSAVLNTYWYYNTSNIRKLDDGSVWVEVKLGEQINGSWRGWMLVKDRLGTYFTSPKIDK